jgi:L-lactate dehydrogenase complex protein LldF
LAKQRASYVKDKVVANLANYLEEFEKNAIKNNIQLDLGAQQQGSGF